MPSRHTCPACSATLNLRDELTGRKVRCPRCQQPFVVPAASVADSLSNSPQPVSRIASAPAPAQAPAQAPAPAPAQALGRFLPPPAPENPEELRSRIQQAFLTASIEPVRVPLLYKLGILLVSVLMVLLPLVYLLIIVLTGILLFRHAVENIWVITAINEKMETISAKALIFGLMLYVAPLVSGVLLM